jgi:hypothetical protein
LDGVERHAELDGVTGETGSDNDHFNWPLDVEVDSTGNIYVVDAFNDRVQKFDSSYTWQMTLGITGECGYDNDHFCEPWGVALDAADNVYISEKWGQRVQVFDPNGTYLATIGGEWGNANYQLREPAGVDVDRDGKVVCGAQLPLARIVTGRNKTRPVTIYSTQGHLDGQRCSFFESGGSLQVFGDPLIELLVSKLPSICVCNPNTIFVKSPN